MQTCLSAGTGADIAVREVDEKNKEVIFKNCSPFSDCISQINNPRICRCFPICRCII